MFLTLSFIRSFVSKRVCNVLYIGWLVEMPRRGGLVRAAGV